MPRAKRLPAEIAADVAAQLMWGPKTASAVMAAVFPESNNQKLVQKYIDQFVASGCAYESGKSNHHATVYAWNPQPFAHVSAAS